MSQSQSPEPVLRNISDTALGVAVYRARESERPDALFRDPFAARLAGERGKQIAASNSFGDKMAWVMVMRTYLYDQFIIEQIQQGTDLVVNLAAGLDARPYRMALPATLKWVEVDLPGILEYKEEVLHEEKPTCELERVRLDLSDVGARRALFARLAPQGKKTLVVTEGLLIYFSESEVGAFAKDLADAHSFQRWIVDLASPGLLRIMQKKMLQLKPESKPSAISFKFGPKEGPDFFVSYGWKPLDVRSPLKTAARFHRLTPLLRLMAELPTSNKGQGSRPWSGMRLLGKI
ncbi:MAG: class I SAM-dependent methyltransferase [Candidatus Acidiferrales bacterium]